VRNLFLALLFANAVFFGWAHWIDRPHESAASDSSLASVPALELKQLPAAPALPVRATAAPASRCRSIGPFADSAAVTSAVETLHSHSVQGRVRGVESSAPDGYWVYVEGLKDAASRRKVISTLNSAGMKDAAALDESERVSVGVFSDQKHAVHRAEQVQELGFKPTLSVHQKVISTPWLDLDIKASDPEPSLESLGFGDAKTAGASLQVTDCPSKAAGG
jgi:hypothetical protein